MKSLDVSKSLVRAPGRQMPGRNIASRRSGYVGDLCFQPGQLPIADRHSAERGWAVKIRHEEIRKDNHLHGGLSEYCILRKYTPVIKNEKPLPLPVIALINCSVATVAGALRLAGSVEDRTVLVTGVGMLGIIACAMCRTSKARKIIALDIDVERLDKARKFGVDVTLKMEADGSSLKERLGPMAEGEQIQAALDFSGVPETMESSLSLLGIVEPPYG